MNQSISRKHDLYEALESKLSQKSRSDHHFHKILSRQLIGRIGGGGRVLAERELGTRQTHTIAVLEPPAAQILSGALQRRVVVLGVEGIAAVVARHPVVERAAIARTQDHLEPLRLRVDQERRILDELLVAVVRGDLDAQAHLLLIRQLLHGLETEPMIAEQIAEALLVLGPHAVERRVESIDAIENARPAALFHLAVDLRGHVLFGQVDVVDAVEFDTARTQDLEAIRRPKLVLGFEHHFGAREREPIAVLEPVAQRQVVRAARQAHEVVAVAEVPPASFESQYLGFK